MPVTPAGLAGALCAAGRRGGDGYENQQDAGDHRGASVTRDARGRLAPPRGAPAAGAGRRARRGRDAAPAGGPCSGRAARRPAARGGRGGRQEPPAELRGRARPAQPPAHDRAAGGVEPRGSSRAGQPWLVLRGAEREAVLWNGPVLELTSAARERLGPDILAEPPTSTHGRQAARRASAASSATRCSTSGSSPGSGTSGRRSRSGARGSHPGCGSTRRPTRSSRERSARPRADARSPRRRRRPRVVYRRAGRPCRRCGSRSARRGQGDDNRTAYWCPGCQVVRGGGGGAGRSGEEGEEPPRA